MSAAVSFSNAHSKSTVSTRRNSYGEFTVKLFDKSGSEKVFARYYTEDRSDALETAKAMIYSNQEKNTEQTLPGYMLPDDLA